MLTGCIESGETLANKVSETNYPEQDSIIGELKHVAQDVAKSTELNDNRVLEVSNLITNHSNIKDISLEDLKGLIKLFRSSGTNKSQTTDVIYKAQYSSNYDGDTITATIVSAYQIGDTGDVLNEVDLSNTALAGKKKIKIRSLLVDAPEIKNKKTGELEDFAIESKNFVQEKLENANSIWLKHDLGDKQDKYGRELMHVFMDQKLLNVLLLEEGLAKIAYINEPNTTYLEEYKQAELMAKENKKGIWSKQH